MRQWRPTEIMFVSGGNKCENKNYNQGNKCSTTTVSYTHLDVYKRQVHRRALVMRCYVCFGFGLSLIHI